MRTGPEFRGDAPLVNREGSVPFAAFDAVGVHWRKFDGICRPADGADAANYSERVCDASRTWRGNAQP